MEKKTLAEIVQIESRYQKSIHLQLDFGNRQKIEQYIPTYSSVKILQEYMMAVMGRQCRNATMLIGPYGKGKSHLLLVLLSILSAPGRENETYISNVLSERIKEVNKDTGHLIKGYVQKGKAMLPVLVSSAGEDLKTAFLRGLQTALRQVGLENITPDNFYAEAVVTIKRWKTEYPETYRYFEKFISKRNMDAAIFIKELENCNNKVMTLFCEMYEKVTAGSRFQPFLETDILQQYRQVNHILCEKYNYSGIYIVFDEFSKYIEGHTKDGFANDMKILQDICELAADSKEEEQLHITLVAHKGIREYGRALPEELVNAFRGIEGRIQEIFFVVTAKNNYALIQSVLKKKAGWEKWSGRRFLTDELWKDSFAMSCFKNTFSEEEYNRVVCEGCYPLLPAAAYLLLAVSEKAAQNERTIFTFLAGDEPGALRRLLDKISVEDGFVDGAAIYDYFQVLFQEMPVQESMRQIWEKAEFAMHKTEDIRLHKVIKVLALIMMLGWKEEISASEENLRLATGMTKEEMKEVTGVLMEKNIIRYRSKYHAYQFQYEMNMDLEKEIQKVIQSQSIGKNREWFIEQLNRVSELEYILPKKYNQQYCMTRYFQYVYLSADMFLRLTEEQLYRMVKEEFQKAYADGKILAVVPESEKEAVLICRKAEMLCDERVMILCPKAAFEGNDSIMNMAAAEILLNDKEFLEQENEFAERELRLYREDMRYEINMLLEQLYQPENGYAEVFYMGIKEPYSEYDSSIAFNRRISNICKTYYRHTPKVNNELINRKCLTPQIKKARDKIMTALLLGENLEGYYKGTSSDATIFRAVFYRTGVINPAGQDCCPMDEGVQKVLEVIQSFIKEGSGKRIAFQRLYDVLEGKKYGVRRGVLPLYLAYELAALEDTPVIYMQGNGKVAQAYVELELNAETLNNVSAAPEQFFLYVEQETMEKEAYLCGLEEVFGIRSEQRKRKQERIRKITKGMQEWYRSLPQYSVNYIPKREVLQRSDKKQNILYQAVKECKRLFINPDLNPRELLLEQLPTVLSAYTELYKKTDASFYELCLQGVRELKDLLDMQLKVLKKRVLEDTKSVFGSRENDNLNRTLSAWYENLDTSVKQHVYTEKTKNIMHFINSMGEDYDEEKMISHFAKVVMGIYMEDWNRESEDIYKEELQHFLQEINALPKRELKEGNQKIQYTNSKGEEVERYYQSMPEDTTAEFLKNALEETLEDFGESVDDGQKVSVLVQLLESILEA